MYSTGIAYLLWLVSGFGALGFHRFYLGRFGTGLLYLFTGGLFGIGGLFDLFYIPTMVRQANLELGHRPSFFDRSPFETFNSGAQTNASGWESIFGSKKESMDSIILKTAKENGGIVTPGEIALKADIPLEKSKEYLEKLVKEGFAEIRVKKTGMMVYVFPEFLTEEKKSELEDF